MIFTETPIPGAYLIDLEKRGDDRGFFARAFCEKEFGAHGLVTNFVQVNNSLSAQKGTLRGMHYQLAPKAETKVVRCIKGALYDLILDLRKDSPTFGKSFGAELTAENRRMMYVPKLTSSTAPSTNAVCAGMIPSSICLGPSRPWCFPTRTPASEISTRPGISPPDQELTR